MNKKELIIMGLALVIIQVLLSLGVFVTPSQMHAYAASKDNFELVIRQLTRIESKVDKLMGY